MSQNLIDTNQTMQDSSPGQVIIIFVALMLFVILVIGSLIRMQKPGAKAGVKHKRFPKTCTDWENTQQPDANATHLTMQSITQQLFQDHVQQQSEADLSWLMNDLVNDISSVPDTSRDF